MLKNEDRCPLGPGTAIVTLPANSRYKSRSIRTRISLRSILFYAICVQFISFSCFLLILCGCGQVNLKSPNTIVATTGTVTFGTVVVGQTATATVGFQNRGLEPIQISATNTDSQLFSITSAHNLPVTVPSGGTYSVTVSFSPNATGATSGQLVIEAGSTVGSAATVGLSGTGTPGIRALACSLLSVSGSGTDACSIQLNAAAPSGGLSVQLSSNVGDVTLPPTVTVPANATSAGFNASIATVSTAQSATLTATIPGAAASLALQLIPNASALKFNASSIAFGSAALSMPITQELIVTSAGNLPISITSAVLAGANFKLVGGSIPVTLNPGQSLTLNIEFNPTTLGVSTGQLVLTSSLANGTTAIPLSGTGVAYEVELNWSPPSAGAESVTGYHVYRSTGGGSNYQLLNSTVDPQTTYTDTTVQGGLVYDYVVATVGSSGTESSPSNATTVTIP
jgi:hypothetical protein